MFKKIIQSIRRLIDKVRSIIIDFKKYGWGLGKEGDKKLIASFSGPKEKLHIFLKRRLKNKNLNSRRCKRLTV